MMPHPFNHDLLREFDLSFSQHIWGFMAARAAVEAERGAEKAMPVNFQQIADDNLKIAQIFCVKVSILPAM